MFKALFGGKKFFGGNRQARLDDAELGKGAWRRSHDRFRRALDRFHQMLEGIDAEAHGGAGAEAGAGGGSGPGREALAEAYARLVPVADSLADLLPEVRRITRTAQATAPGEDMGIPVGTGGYLNDVNRELSQAGGALAAAAEATAMVRLGVSGVAGVERKAELVAGHVTRAAELLAAGLQASGQQARGLQENGKPEAGGGRPNTKQ